MDKEDCFALGMGVGVVVMLIMLIVVYSVFFPVNLTKQTANDICLNLTKIEGVVGSSDGGEGKLTCEVPSFDSTSNIIVINNGEEE